MPRDVPQTRQVDRAEDGCATLEDHTWGRYLIHGRSLQARVPQRSGAENAHTSSEFDEKSLPYLLALNRDPRV